MRCYDGRATWWSGRASASAGPRTRSARVAGAQRGQGGPGARARGVKGTSKTATGARRRASASTGAPRDPHLAQHMADRGGRPPLGSPEPGAPDRRSDNPGPVSGPPPEGRRPPGRPSRRLMTGAPVGRRRDRCPTGCARRRVVVAGDPGRGDALPRPACWPTSLLDRRPAARRAVAGRSAAARSRRPDAQEVAALAGRLRDAAGGPARRRRDHHLVVERLVAGYSDLAAQVSTGIGKVQKLSCGRSRSARGSSTGWWASRWTRPATTGRSPPGPSARRGPSASGHRDLPDAAHAVLLPQGRPLDLAVADRLLRGGRAPTSTRPAGARGGH